MASEFSASVILELRTIDLMNKAELALIRGDYNSALKSLSLARKIAYGLSAIEDKVFVSCYSQRLGYLTLSETDLPYNYLLIYVQDDENFHIDSVPF